MTSHRHCVLRGSPLRGSCTLQAVSSRLSTANDTHHMQWSVCKHKAGSHAWLKHTQSTAPLAA